MRNLFSVLCTLLCIGSCLGGAEPKQPKNQTIQHYDSIEQFLPVFDQVTSKTMVVFDLDDTLITKTDKSLRPPANYVRTGYYFRLVQRYSFDHILHLVSIVEEFCQPELVSPLWPQVIQSLQSKTPLVIAHTAAPPKQLGLFDFFPAVRERLLKTFDIDFSSAREQFPDAELTQLNHIPDVSPVMHAGMLFSENYSKGEALVVLLKHYDIKPELVIFVDDQLNNLKQTEKELAKLGIPFVGIHYEEKSLFEDTFDADIAEIQFYNLVEHEKWLDDEAARIVLETEGLPQEDEGEMRDENPLFQEDDTEELWSF